MHSDPAFIDSLLQVIRTLRRHYDDCAREMGLTMARARILSMLTEHEGVSQTELAALLEIETPTLKRQLDALEGDGFLERRRIDGDARKNAIFMTPRGRSSNIIAFGQKLRSDVLEGITPEDLTRAQKVLDHITRNIAALDRK